MNNIKYCEINLPDFDMQAIKSYAKTKSFSGLPIDECLNEMSGLKHLVAFAEFDVIKNGKNLSLGFSNTASDDLSRLLENSEKILVFGATIGFLPDKLIAKYSKISPTKAVLFQAIGTERIEALCDTFCSQRKEYYNKLGLDLTARFSPGYGDLSIDIQKDIVKALDLNKLLGITLTESLLMMPSKSVTAIMGIKGE